MDFDINAIIKQISRDEGVSSENVRAEIQRAIDIAWDSKNEQEIKNQRKLFPKGKPSIEEFLKALHDKLKDND